MTTIPLGGQKVGRNQPFIARTNTELRTQAHEKRMQFKLFGWSIVLFTVYSVICLIASWLRRDAFTAEQIDGMKMLGYHGISDHNSFANFGDWLRSHVDWALPILIVAGASLGIYAITRNLRERARSLSR